MTNIVTKGINITVTEAVSNHIQDQFSSIVDHYENFITNNLAITLNLDAKHSKKSHNIKASIPIKGKNIFVEDTGEDMYKVISNVVSKANVQMRKLKTRHTRKINKRNLFIESEEVIEDESDFYE